MAEKEHIERWALYKDVSSLEVVAYKSDNEDFNNGVIFILEKLDAIPAADVVEVVRCKDCKYYKTSPLLYPKTKRKFCYKVLKSNGIAVGHGFNETDFCSYGERKEQK